jgi:CRP-like cAMP-binding protein
MTLSTPLQEIKAASSGMPPPLLLKRGADQEAAPTPGQAAASALLTQALQQAWSGLLKDDEALLALAHLGRSHRIRQRGILLRDGVCNTQGSLWFLVRGKLSMGRRDTKNVWRQGRALQGGQWIDLASAWPQAPFPETALALTPVLAHEFPANDVLELCASHPVLLKLLLNSVGRAACEAMAARQAMSTQDFPARLAQWLFVEQKLQGSGECLNLGLLKRDLAAQLGVTPETLSRTLRQFQQQGLIEMHHRELRILAPARMAALS